MKKIYMIYETDWGFTGKIFNDKKSANLYVKFVNDLNTPIYYVREQEVYDSFEEHITKDNSKMISDIKRIIENLQNGFRCHNLHFKNGKYKMQYRIMKEIVKNNKIDICAWWDKNDKYCKVVKSDLQVVIDKYNQINKKVKKYKAIAKVLQKNQSLEKTTLKQLEETIEL